MTWNYRVIKDKDSSLGLYEVYYDGNDEIEFCTENPILGKFEDMDDLKTALEHMLHDVNKRVENDALLDMKELEKKFGNKN